MSPHLPRHHHPHDERPQAESAPPYPARAPLHGPAMRLTVYLGECDQFHRRPVFTEIVHRAHRAGLAGASVFRGIEGFGAGSLIHTTRLLDLAEDLPVAVVIIDTEERIREFLPQLREVATDSLITLDNVKAISLMANVVQPGPEEGTR